MSYHLSSRYHHGRGAAAADLDSQSLFLVNIVKQRLSVLTIVNPCSAVLMTVNHC